MIFKYYIYISREKRTLNIDILIANLIKVKKREKQISIVAINKREGLVLGPLLFLIYINDLPHDIFSICKMLVDDTSLFLKVKDSSLSLSDLNDDLETTNQCARQ